MSRRSRPSSISSAVVRDRLQRFLAFGDAKNGSRSSRSGNGPLDFMASAVERFSASFSAGLVFGAGEGEILPGVATGGTIGEGTGFAVAIAAELPAGMGSAAGGTAEGDGLGCVASAIVASRDGTGHADARETSGLKASRWALPTVPTSQAE